MGGVWRPPCGWGPKARAGVRGSRPGGRARRGSEVRGDVLDAGLRLPPLGPAGTWLGSERPFSMLSPLFTIGTRDNTAGPLCHSHAAAISRVLLHGFLGCAGRLADTEWAPGSSVRPPVSHP